MTDFKKQELDAKNKLVCIIVRVCASIFMQIAEPDKNKPFAGLLIVDIDSLKSQFKGRKNAIEVNAIKNLLEYAYNIFISSGAGVSNNEVVDIAYKVGAIPHIEFLSIVKNDVVMHHEIGKIDVKILENAIKDIITFNAVLQPIILCNIDPTKETVDIKISP